MWFCFSSDFLNLPFTRHIKEKCPKQSPNIPKHILDAIQLISSSLNYPVTKRNASSAIAWQVLVEDGILREVDNGYSAIEWLKEQGLFIDKKRPRAVQKADKTNEHLQKIAVRENVMLTQNELNSLKEKYPFDKLEDAFDKLSNYKTRTGKVYRSDYRALLAWAIDAASNQTSTDVRSARLSEPSARLSEPSARLSEHPDTPEISPEQKALNLQRLNNLLISLS